MTLIKSLPHKFISTPLYSLYIHYTFVIVMYIPIDAEYEMTAQTSLLAVIQAFTTGKPQFFTLHQKRLS